MPIHDWKAALNQFSNLFEDLMPVPKPFATLRSTRPGQALKVRWGPTLSGFMAERVKERLEPAVEFGVPVSRVAHR
jgi:hypothetical protein